MSPLSNIRFTRRHTQPPRSRWRHVSEQLAFNQFQVFSQNNSLLGDTLYAEHPTSQRYL